MGFEFSAYGDEVRAILALHGEGGRAMPLANGTPLQAGVEAIGGRDAAQLFPNALSPGAALAGLYLYFGAYEQAHALAQDIATPEGSFWHGILHRQEPDASNAAYWFRRVGQHPVFPPLREAAAGMQYPVGDRWDPFAFIEYCETARHKPGSKNEEKAMAIQLAEWQLLFDYCARPQP